MYIGLTISMLGLLSREIFIPKRYLSKKTIRNTILDNPSIGLIYLQKEINNKNLNKNFERKSYYKGQDMTKSIFHGLVDYNKSAFSLEHIFPISFLRENPMSRYDFHNIFLTKAYINIHRSNYAFIDEDELSFSDNYLRDLWKICHKTSSLSLHHYNKYDFLNHNYKSNNRRLFIPNHFSRGKIARTLAYMKFVYPELKLTNVINKETLVKWNQQFPVSEEEFERNDVIKEIQGNTNPFIDGSIKLWSKL